MSGDNGNKEKELAKQYDKFVKILDLMPCHRGIVPHSPDWNHANLSLEAYKRKHHRSRILYKYQAINYYSLDALKNNYLYFSTHKQLNDPSDPFLSLLFKAQDPDLIRKDALQLAVMAERDAKIQCMTSIDCHPLLWAHYADSWRGMQITYATIEHPSYFMPIDYSSDFPGKRDVLDLLRVKMKSWSYEMEWRAFLFQEEQKVRDYAYPIAVTLGPRTDDEMMRRVRDALPVTVERFEVVYPVIEHGECRLGVFDIEHVIDKYSGLLPNFDQMYWKETKISKPSRSKKSDPAKRNHNNAKKGHKT